MPEPMTNSNSATTNGATVGYEAELWRMADAMRGSMDGEREHISRWELPRFLSTDDEGMGFRSLEYRDNGNAHSVKHLRLQEFSASARRLLSGPFPLPVNPVDLTGNGNGKSSRSHRAVRRNP